MRRHSILALVLCAAIATALHADPQWGYISPARGDAVASLIAASGTNSSIEVVYSNDVPCRLSEVLATTNGIATDCTVDRMWYLTEQVTSNEVVTNFHGFVLTNSVQTWTRSVQTNQIYDSTADTLPDNEYILENDVLKFDFGSVTNVILRALGIK